MKFEQPTTLEEALHLLQATPQLTILAGGTDVVVHRRAGRLTPMALMDITRIPQLQEIDLHEGVLTIGAAVTCTQLERSERVRSAFPTLNAAAATVGSPQIRSRATIGGNVANASPAADLLPALVAADTVAVVQSVSGVRKVLVTELVIGASGNGLKPGELIAAFELLPFSQSCCWSFEKIGRRNALAISRLNGACSFVLEQGRMRDVRLSIGAATDRPARFTAAEQLLEGKEAEETLFREAGNLVAREIEERTGVRESSRYKLPVSAALTVRLLKTAQMRDMI